MDEADNIFIDEARTPLIIERTHATGDTGRKHSSTTGPTKSLGNVVLNEHFTFDEKKQKIEVTDQPGPADCSLLELRPPVRTHTPWTSCTSISSGVCRPTIAIAAISITWWKRTRSSSIDEFTSRRMPDRHWREGLHQAVEAPRKDAHFVGGRSCRTNHLPKPTSVSIRSWEERPARHGKNFLEVRFGSTRFGSFVFPQAAPSSASNGPTRVCPNEDTSSSARWSTRSSNSENRAGQFWSALARLKNLPSVLSQLLHQIGIENTRCTQRPPARTRGRHQIVALAGGRRLCDYRHQYGRSVAPTSNRTRMSSGTGTACTSSAPSATRPCVSTARWQDDLDVKAIPAAANSLYLWMTNCSKAWGPIGKSVWRNGEPPPAMPIGRCIDRCFNEPSAGLKGDTVANASI